MVALLIVVVVSRMVVSGGEDAVLGGMRPHAASLPSSTDCAGLPANSVELPGRHDEVSRRRLGQRHNTTVRTKPKVVAVRSAAYKLRRITEGVDEASLPLHAAQPQ